MRGVRGRLAARNFCNGRLTVERRGERVVVEILEPVRLEVGVEEPDWLEVLVVGLLRLRTSRGERVVSQGEAARAFGVSRQMINRRSRTQQKHGLAELLREDYEKSKLTPAVRRRVAELLVSDWWMSDEAMAQHLIEEGVVKRISRSTVHVAVREVDGCELRSLMRRWLQDHDQEDRLDRDWILDGCFDLIEALLSADSCRAQARYDDLSRCREQYGKPRRRGPYKLDRHVSRRHLARDIGRKRRRIGRILDGQWSIWDGPSRRPYCPDCGSLVVGHKEDRPRSYSDDQGQIREVQAASFRCYNPQCRTHTFTHHVPGLEYWARHNVRAKGKILKQVFHVRASYPRACDYLAEEDHILIRASTALAWVRKAGAEASALEEFIETPFSGVLSLDEKWVKLRKQWVYIYKAVDALSGELLTADVFPSRGKQPSQQFILQVKALGYLPETVVTDLTSDYDHALGIVYPTAHHHRCIFHAEQSAATLIRQAFPKDGDPQDALKTRLRAEIRKVFACRHLSALDQTRQAFQTQEDDFPSQAKPVFQAMQRYIPHLRAALAQPHLIPLTNNAAEQVIAEFDRRYQVTGGFHSLHSIREYLKCFITYCRLRSVHTRHGPKTFHGRDFPSLTWTELLLAC